MSVDIYRTLKAALLVWKELSRSLKQCGCVINLHNWCVANKDINGTQCTIVWYVDDPEISHKDPSVVNKVVASLSDKYGKVGKMTVRRGKKYDYLGMTLNFSEDDKFIVDMKE